MRSALHRPAVAVALMLSSIIALGAEARAEPPPLVAAPSPNIWQQTVSVGLTAGVSAYGELFVRMPMHSYISPSLTVLWNRPQRLWSVGVRLGVPVSAGMSATMDLDGDGHDVTAPSAVVGLEPSFVFAFGGLQTWLGFALQYFYGDVPSSYLGGDRLDPSGMRLEVLAGGLSFEQPIYRGLCLRVEAGGGFGIVEIRGYVGGGLVLRI